jgi:hypothetical protein
MFQHYTQTVQNSALWASSKNASIGDNVISFGEHGKIAVVTEDGLRCDQDLFPSKTSKEFAQMLFESLTSVVRTAHFERGKSPVKWMISGKPVFEIGEATLELHSTSGMSHFDKWVFEHLEKLWKERKV